MRRVLRLQPNSTTEDLLYDFNLIQGSLVPIRLVVGLPPALFNVTSVDSILTNSDYRKRLTLQRVSGTFTSVPVITWIEGIGCTTHPFYFEPIYVSDPSYKLVCSYQDSLQIYHNSLLGSCPNPFTITNTSELEQDNTLSNTQLYPNPTTGEINIQLDGLEEVSIDIYTMTGQLIYHQDNINTPLHSININNKAAGVYLAKIRSKQHYKQLLFVKE